MTITSQVLAPYRVLIKFVDTNFDFQAFRISFPLGTLCLISDFPCQKGLSRITPGKTVTGRVPIQTDDLKTLYNSIIRHEDLKRAISSDLQIGSENLTTF